MVVRTEEEGGIISNTQPHDTRGHTHTHAQRQELRGFQGPGLWALDKSIP